LLAKNGDNYVYMAIESTKERWYWQIARLAVCGIVLFVAIFTSVLLVTLFTKDQLRLSLQDGSTQSCFLKSH